MNHSGLAVKKKTYKNLFDSVQIQVFTVIRESDFTGSKL